MLLKNFKLPYCVIALLRYWFFTSLRLVSAFTHSRIHAFAHSASSLPKRFDRAARIEIDLNRILPIRLDRVDHSQIIQGIDGRVNAVAG